MASFPQPTATDTWTLSFWAKTEGTNTDGSYVSYEYDDLNQLLKEIYVGTGVLDGSYTSLIEYTYDAWGKILSRTGTMANSLGVFNPFRYRGYIYDEESGLYYLQ